MFSKDEEWYLKATKEVDSKDRRPALWAKSLAMEFGDETQARYRYIQLRVAEQLDENSSTTMQKRGTTDSKGGIDQHSQAYLNHPDINYATAQKIRHRHSLFRRILGVLVLSLGIGAAIFTISVLYMLEGEKLSVVLLAATFCGLMAWPLLAGGWKEMTASGFAGIGTAIVGILLWVGQLVVLSNFLEEQNLTFSDLMNLPAFADLFAPGLFVASIGLLLTYIGFSGRKRNLAAGSEGT